MNISEFERTKPQKTYQQLDNLINKYRSLSEINMSEEEEDVCSSQYTIRQMITKEVARDLTSFKETFLTGE
jgi:hypothetical protein